MEKRRGVGGRERGVSFLGFSLSCLCLHGFLELGLGDEGMKKSLTIFF